MGPQLTLPFTVDDRRTETLIVKTSNRAAWEALRGWRAWPGGAIALTGPAKSGKSHMAAAWAREAGAWTMGRDAGPEAAAAAFRGAGGRLVVDDLHLGFDDAALTLLVDLGRAGGGALLLVGRSGPAHWPSQSPDLASRLAALPRVRLEEPDLELLAGVLRRLTRARFLELPAPVADYLATHMERSYAAAHAMAEALDREIKRANAPVTYEVARRALRSLGADAPEEETA